MHVNDRKLFIYGLPPDCKEDQLKDFLEAVCRIDGGVRKVHIPSGKTYAFVVLSRPDVKEAFLGKTLLYFGGNGMFYQVKACRYRPRPNHSLAACIPKPTACQVTRCDKSIKYKSPDHVHFTPNYNMTSLSLPKKKKRKRGDGLVWFDDCGATRKKQVKAKRKEKEKRPKLVAHPGESFQFGLVIPESNKVIPEVGDEGTKRAKPQGGSLAVDQEVNSEERGVQTASTAEKSTKLLSACTENHQSVSCNEDCLLMPESKKTLSDRSAGGTNSIPGADNLLTSIQELSSTEASTRSGTVKAANTPASSPFTDRSRAQVIIEHGYIGPLCFEITRGTTVGDIKNEIMTRTGLPTGTQTLYFDFKKLADNLTVHCLLEKNQNSVTLKLCDGGLKGGVRNGEDAVAGITEPTVTQEGYPSMESWNLDQTISWLRSEGLPEKYVKCFRDENVSGKALLILGAKPEQLAVFKIKQGPLTNLLDSLKPHLDQFNRTKPLTAQTVEKSFSVEDLCAWLRELRLPEKSLQIVEEEEIDGRAFVSMWLSNKLQETLKLEVGPWAVLQHELTVHEEMGKKGEAGSSKAEAEHVQEGRPHKPDDEKPTTDEFAWRLEYKEPLAVHCPSTTGTKKKADLSKDDDLLKHLQRALKLSIKAPAKTQEYNECTIRSVFVKRGGGANALEKMFSFLVITKGVDSQLSNDALRQLWRNIIQRTHDWMKLFSGKDKQAFLLVDDAIKSVHDQQEVLLRDGPVCQIRLEKVSADDFENMYFVILIDDQIKKKEFYSFFSDKKEKRKFLVELGDNGSRYHASFNTNSPGRGLRWSKHFKTLIGKAGSVFTQSEKQPSTLNYQAPRIFNNQVGNKTYTRGFVLDCLETGVKDLISPVHEFKLYRRGVEEFGEDESIKKFVFETLRFACGCLNERTNGTIHFGVADEKESQAGDYRPREIVGVPVCSLPLYNEKLTEYIDKCFVGPSKSLVHNCVHPPVFVPVRAAFQQQQSSSEVVIEVDIQPCYSFSADEIFKARFKILGKGKQDAVAYSRHGSETKEMDSADVEDYLQKRRPKLDEERKRRERQTNKVQESPQRLFAKLQKLVCASKKVLDSSVYPVLVVNKPAEMMTQEFLEENFKFLSSINWQIIVDFDDQGSKDRGLCKVSQSGPGLLHCDIHEAEDFDQDDDMLGNIYYRTHWIFGNGYTKLGKEAFGFKQWNNSKRKRGISKIIQSLGKELPKTRALVMFLLLSKDYEPMADTFKDFCTYFSGPNQLVYVAENQEVVLDWEAELSRTCLEEHQLRERSVVGMSWAEFQECFKQMVSGTDQDQLYVTMVTGSLYPLKKVPFSCLKIVSAKECEELATLEPNQREENSTLEQVKFYQGYPVTWKNFWFTDRGKNHVLRRDNYQELKSRIQKLLRSGSEGKVQTITLYHHIGAGASTMGRQALWDFRHEQDFPCRCALVTKIDDSTSAELLTLRRIGCREEKENACPPLLVLVEDTDEILFRELRLQVVDLASTLPRTDWPVCVFLYCKATLKPYDCHMKETATSVFLMQDLSPKEVQWFTDKYTEMEEKFHHKDPKRDFEKYANENLISFMLMKENFNPSYARSIVERNLNQVTQDELTLLEYTSLLSIYDPYPLFASCFDTIMVSAGLYTRGYRRDWVEHLTHSARIFLRDVDCSTHLGTGRAIAIIHPVIASELLDQIAKRKSLSVSQIALNFLMSHLIKDANSSFPSRYLRDGASSMLKHRKKYEYGDDEETKFSPLIEKILYVNETDNGKEATEQSIKQAVELLMGGLELFKDPGLAQQIARVFYLNVSAFSKCKIEHCFGQALKFCTKAIEMESNNAFLDTMGRILESKMKVLYGAIRGDNRVVEIMDVNDMLPLAFDAISWFQKAQAASDDIHNTSGFRGELSVMFCLLDVLSCIRIFRGQAGMKKLKLYLAVSPVVPTEVETVWERFHTMLKGLRKRFVVCMEAIAEEFTIYKENSVRAKRIPHQIARFKAQYYSYFGEEGIKLDTPDEKWECRWQRINQYLGGDIFSSVFSIDRVGNGCNMNNARAILERLRTMAFENFEEPTYRETYKDLLLIVTTSMALYSPFRLKSKSAADPVEEYNEIYRFVVRLCALEEYEGRKRLYAHLFKVMFLWPRSDLELSGNNRVQDFYDALANIKKRWKEKGHGNVDADKIGKQKMYKYMTFKSQERQYTTLFYLGQGSGLAAFVHANELPQSSAKGKQSLDWEHKATKKRLRRLEGVVESKKNIRVQNPLDSRRSIDVYYSSSRLGGFSKEKVSFYLGFSWPHPIAFDVQYPNSQPLDEHPRRGLLLEHRQSDNFSLPRRPFMTYEQYTFTMRELVEKIEEIDRLKKEKNSGGILSANEESKLRKEEKHKKKLQELKYSLNSPDFEEDV